MGCCKKNDRRVTNLATVLLIDDHKCSSRHMVRRLRAAGHDVCIALDAEEAIRLFRLHPVDAVVLDCGLCRPSNLDPLPVFRRLRSDVPMIMISSYCGIGCDQMRDADACIQQGESEAVLLRTIEAMLCARRYGLVRSVAA
jgi:ActR/RegA family two-component response regulator